MMHPFIRISRKTVRIMANINKQKYRRFSIIPPPNEDNTLWLILSVGIALSLIKWRDNPPPIGPGIP